MTTVIHPNFPIGDRFTWRVPVTARYFAQVASLRELREVLDSSEFRQCSKYFVLGKGANTLFSTPRYDGFVIQIDLKGITHLQDTDTHVSYRIAAGEDWHETARHFVHDLHLGGMENLAYIPGTFGAAPIQNVAAYGQAFEDVFVELEALEILTGEVRTFTHNDAQFRYRDSFFKSSDFRSRYIIISVTVRLEKPQAHHLETGYHSRYESLKSELGGDGPFDIGQIFDAVTRLRKKKLPEISEVGTNGSTFMNPIVIGIQVKRILERFPELQYYPTRKMSYPDKSQIPVIDDHEYKIAAGYIFDQLGWRGRIIGGVGTWKNHALVVCNYSATDPQAIVEYVRAMQSDFEKATGISITPEINIVE